MSGSLARRPARRGSFHPALLLVEGGTWQDRVGAITGDLRSRGAAPGPVAWLRVDDDDLLAATFMDRLFPLVTAPHVGYCVTFGKGLAAEYASGRVSRFGLTHRIMVALGLSFIGSLGVDGKVTFPPLTSHVRVHREMPTLVDSREVAYLRVLHDQQDRNLAAEEPTKVQNPTDMYDVEHLAADLERLFPTLVGAADLPESSLPELLPPGPRSASGGDDDR